MHNNRARSAVWCRCVCEHTKWELSVSTYANWILLLCEVSCSSLPIKLCVISCPRFGVADMTKEERGSSQTCVIESFQRCPMWIQSEKQVASSVSRVSQRFYSSYSIIQKPLLRCSAGNVSQCFAEVKKDVQLQSDLVTMDSTFHKSGSVALSLWKMETVNSK